MSEVMRFWLGNDGSLTETKSEMGLVLYADYAALAAENAALREAIAKQWLTHTAEIAALREAIADQPSSDLAKFAADLAAAQRPLDPLAEKILYENLPDLYIDGSTPDKGKEVLDIPRFLRKNDD